MLARPFLNTGIDVCGPFMIRIGAKESKRTSKAYIAVFICLTTSAVHLEVVSDLSTEAFMADLRRFTSHRGTPVNIYSDNGTNFVGASNQLKELQTFLQDPEKGRKSSRQGITWRFTPAAAPHFGGA